MIYLQGNQLSRRFGADTLFENIHIEIHDTSRIALVGRNGAGKSTLLKIINGEESPDDGTISLMKGTKIGYLAQNTGLNSSRTIWEEMLSAFNHLLKMEEEMKQLELSLGDTSVQSNESLYEKKLEEYANLQHDFKEQNGYGYESEMRSVLHGFQFDESYYDRIVETLSGGQKTRLALAKLLLEQPQILILDEPTNHLDIETLSWLEGYLHNYKGSLLIVSHDRYFLDKVVNEVYELSRGEATHFTGNYSRYMKLKEEKLEAEWKQFEKQQVEIKQLEDFVAKNLVRASTTKRAQSRRKKLEKMDRLDKPQGDEKSANFLFNIERTSGNIVLQLEDAAVGYDSEILSSPISIDLRKQNAVALVGPNGVGKSTLLKSIIGEIPFIKGEAHFGTNVDIGYYDQEQTKLHSTKTVLEELWSEHTTTPEKEIRNVLGSFLFSGEDVKKTVPLLSGGEKARLALAKLAMDEQNFLILDEPTNHLDIDSKEVLENALIDYEGTLFFVSHDRYFINRVATQIIELSQTGSRLYLGDYDYYIEKKREEEERASLLAKQNDVNEVKQQAEGKRTFEESKEQQKLIRSTQRRITEIEESLEKIEQTIEDLHDQMNSVEIADDHEKLTEIGNVLDDCESQQEKLLEDWEEQSLILEDYQTE